MSRKNDSTQNKKRLKWEKPCLMKLENPTTKGNGTCGSGSSALTDCFTGNLADWCFGGSGGFI